MKAYKIVGAAMFVTTAYMDDDDDDNNNSSRMYLIYENIYILIF